ncbi:uncharacterized protein AAES06_013570 [Glossophaga mutica]
MKLGSLVGLGPPTDSGPQSRRTERVHRHPAGSLPDLHIGVSGLPGDHFHPLDTVRPPSRGRAENILHSRDMFRAMRWAHRKIKMRVGTLPMMRRGRGSGSVLTLARSAQQVREGSFPVARPRPAPELAFGSPGLATCEFATTCLIASSFVGRRLLHGDRLLLSQPTPRSKKRSEDADLTTNILLSGFETDGEWTRGGGMPASVPLAKLHRRTPPTWLSHSGLGPPAHTDPSSTGREAGLGTEPTRRSWTETGPGTLGPMELLRATASPPEGGTRASAGSSPDSSLRLPWGRWVGCRAVAPLRASLPPRDA